ncbi:MAG: hypothetical protein LBD35_00675 [Prevotellaceae bacterium]|jgi:uncharacterized protein YfaS (alpha-2-macroglobulin family)|nr:hypothetical protein [Prevotellaceae bacterium]
MNVKKLLRLFLFLPAAGMFLLSCESKPAGSDNDLSPDYNPYVLGFTSGNISVKSNITIELSETSVFDADEEVPDNLFEISPSVKGKIQMHDNRQDFVFIPDENLKVAQKYLVKFKVGKAVKNVKKEFREFAFSFTTIKPSFYMVRDGLKLYSETTPHIFKLERNVYLSDYADPSAVEKMLKVSSGIKLPAPVWEHEGNLHKFVIDSIKTGESASELKLNLDAKYIGGDIADEETLRIPSKYEFDILGVSMNKDDDEQTIICRFSAPIDAKQNLKGIVSLENERFTYRISLNTIMLYPAETLRGQVTLNIFEGLKSASGGTLGKHYSEELQFESDSPEVKFLSEGSILPGSTKGTVLAFQAVGVKSVTAKIVKIHERNMLQFLQVNSLDGNLELKRAGRPAAFKTIKLDDNKTPKELKRWGTYALDLSKLVTPEQGAIYRVELFFTQKQAIIECEDASDDTAATPTDEELLQAENDGYDDHDTYDYTYYYDDDFERNPCSKDYYRTKKAHAVKNVLASDLGLIAKKGSGNTIRFIASNLHSVLPVPDVSVEVYNYQQQLLGSGTTNNEGFVDVAVSGKAYAAVARHGKQRAYLHLNDGEAISLSRFDVAGDAVKNGLKGFVYGERGVWRPGDSIFLTFVLQDFDNKIPASHPVIMELNNSRGQQVARQSKMGGLNGFYTFVCPTDNNAPTGDWSATVKVGGVSFHKTVKVETVKPNRLKINLTFDSDVLDFSLPVKGTLSAKWLHGAPAKNSEAQISMTLSKTATVFKGYEGYVFDDLTKEMEAEEKNFLTGKLNDAGSLSFSEKFDLYSKAPGKLTATFVTKVAEEGGDFSLDKLSMEVSPYKRYVGINQPKGTGRNNMLETDRNQTFNIVLLDQNGRTVNENQNLSISVYKLDWSWWWSSSNSSSADFNYSSYSTSVHRETVKASGGRALFSYKALHGEYGFYLIKATDAAGGHSAATVAYYDWPGWGGRARQGQEKVTMLAFESDKESYNTGETALIVFPSSNTARALVSIENGTKVLNTYWVDCKNNETKIEIKTTPEMTPNVYVSISMVQPYAQTQNDLPVRMFGVIPLNVVDPETKLDPVLEVPEVIKPEEKYKITVSEARGLPMTYTLAVVDEGLLDLTRFKTPDPWRYFYAKEALGVQTWDLYSSLIGAYGGHIDRLFAVGGSDAAAAGKTKINRFKPVVRFIGPFSADKGNKNTHELEMHNYIGSVRVMLVAGNRKAYGFAEKSVPVKKPLMVVATLPRVLAPGEEINLPVTVFATDSKINKADISIETNELFSVAEKKHSLTFASAGEEMTHFALKVNEKAGAGKIRIIARSGVEQSEYNVELEVRMPNPPITKVRSVVLEAGKKESISESLPGIDGTNTARIEASFIPALNLGERLQYLIRYPHGCLEQTTSAAFPQLYLNSVTELSSREKSSASYNVKAALNKLKSFAGVEGGFMYWPGQGYCDEWATSYAGEFMLEAEKKGFSLPSGMKQNWLKFQQKKARARIAHAAPSAPSSPLLFNQSDLIQAYRLYTLAKAKAPELGAMNRLKNDKTLSAQARWVLASAYALAGQTEVAAGLIERAETNVKEYTSSFSQTYGSSVRDMAMILDALILMKRESQAFELVRTLSRKLNSDQTMSTQTTAYALMGMSRYAESLKENKSIDLAYSIDGGDTKKINTRKPLWTEDLGNVASGKFELENKSKNTVFAQITATGIPAAGQEAAFENKIKIAVAYMIGDTPVDPAKLERGTDFRAVVKVTNIGPSREKYTNIALTEVFPSGWEIFNERLFSAGKDKNSSEYDYRDIRDDRVLTYFSLDAGETKQFFVKLNATYTGKFYLPAFKVEAMYDPSIRANNTGQWVEVSG